MSWTDVKQTINAIETARGEWCGMPLPLAGLGLQMESRYPHCERIATLQALFDGNDPPATARRARQDGVYDGCTVRNRFHSAEAHGEVIIWHDRTGAIQHGVVPDVVKRNIFHFGPYETLDAWDLDTELTAMETLATLLSEKMYKSYVITSQFLETSKRSGLTYYFRRLRPTIVMSPRQSRCSYFHGGSADDGQMRILTTLCLHPLGYYAGTRCGAMAPTDDVIAHLLLMRGDEHMLWKRANHHAPHRPESGL